MIKRNFKRASCAGNQGHRRSAEHAAGLAEHHLVHFVGELHGEFEGGKPWLHLRAENCNVTRRMLATADQSDSRMALAVARFARVKPERRDIVRVAPSNFRARISASNSSASWRSNFPMIP